MKTLRIAAAVTLSLCLFSSASSQDKKLTPVTVGYSAISGSFAPLWVAFDQGLFARHGLDVKLTYIQGNRVMMSALTAGEIQLYQGGAEGLIRLISGGGDGIFIASQYNFVGHYVLITDPKITRLDINGTCERCRLTDEECRERVSPPHLLQLQRHRAEIEEELNSLR